jgi:ribose transport system ATP-binding protein
MVSETDPLLEVSNVTKRFPGVIALQDVNLRLGHGEVLAVIGENGAGKSTLMKILAGVQQPDSGQLRISGQVVRVDSCRKALELGVVLIHQELNLADNLSVSANIFLGREPRRFGLIDDAKMAVEAQTYLNMVGLAAHPSELVSRMTIGQQQMVEIAKALSIDARIIIMDEPTSSLSTRESEALFVVIRDLKQRGVSIIYISHRLGEVSELADRVVVLRDGRNSGEIPGDEISHDRMVQLMVGRDLAQFYRRKAHSPGDVVLEVENLVTTSWPNHQVSFAVHGGEIVGVAGLVGAGRTELLHAIFGIDERLGGTVRIAGQTVGAAPPVMIKQGVALVPEDRKKHGVILEMSVQNNIGLAGLRRNQLWGGLLNGQQEQLDSVSMIDRLQIKTPSRHQIVRNLSGGNQQKVVIGKWLTMSPKVLLLDEPTRGIDIGAKQEIYRLMEELAGQGVAILFVSSELEEIIGMSDRSLVMHEGRITGELQRDELSEVAIMQLATGQVSQVSDHPV